jgi:hypothetical protein
MEHKMSIVDKITGPKSKYKKDLPYTYRAQVNEIPDVHDVTSNYFADTLCGIIDYLRENDIDPQWTTIYGVYRKKEVKLDTSHCVNNDGKWLERPDICHAIEKKYRETLDEIYKGHVEKGNCEFEDRDRDGMGPN